MSEHAEDRLVVETERTDDGPLVRLVGELDPHTVALLDQRLDPLLAETPDRVTLELSGLRFIDSSGLRVLITASNRLLEHDGRLVLLRPSTTVVRLLEVTGLLDQLAVEDVD